MGTKKNPGTFDCYANAEPDEPMFVLLARDPLAPELVRRWAYERATTRGVSPKVTEALACAEAMKVWREANCCTSHPTPEGKAHADRSE